VFKHLQIPYRDERWLVGLADTGLQAVRLAGWPRPADRESHEAPQRILLLRLERVGDLLMVLDAIATVRAMAPHAEIDLVVGSWNLRLARTIPAVNSVETLDAPWMAREGRGLSWKSLITRARAWREKGYDLALNFEPDIRSNLLLALSGAPRRAGFISGGGGALLTDALTPEPRAHTADNAKALVAQVFRPTVAKRAEPRAATEQAVKLNIPDEARRRAAEIVGTPTHDAPLVGIQPAAGRQIKEWEPARFAEVGSQLVRTRGASVMLIGSAGDRSALDAMRAAWPPDVPLAELPVETDLVVLAAVLERLTLFITGDTGPMHLAAAMGTPVLAIFGPSLPTRYAPLSPRSRIVRIDIHCSPCNLMRRPPERCVGHVPDCLAGITSASVLRAAEEMLGS
jgi:lipopolysaccharide heptosyltransferase II